MTLCGTVMVLIHDSPRANEEERTVRKNRRINAGLVAAAAVIASLLAFAGGGQAASPQICTTPSSLTSNASCVTELVAPHVLTANGDGLSITNFTNQSGVGGSTATKVVLSVKFPSQVTIKTIKILINGTAFSSPCVPPSVPVQTVSCSIGNISGGGKAKMIVRFSTATGGVVVGSASYGEGKNDSAPPRPNGTVNDTQLARDVLEIAGSGAAGGCLDAAEFAGGHLAHFSGSTASQSTAASFGQADSSLNLPCTPGSAGVDTVSTHRPASFTQSVSFAEFMMITANAVGTVTIDFLSSLPSGFVLKELLVGTDPTVETNWQAVPPCVSGLPPTGSDSCIVSRTDLPSGGAQYILHALGSTFDPRYGG